MFPSRPSVSSVYVLIFTVFFARLCFCSEIGCAVGTFACATGGGCVDDNKLCDTYRDCSDGSDELDCPVPCADDWFRCHDGKKCMPRTWVCDGTPECEDTSDELNCGKVAAECKSNEFRCHDNRKCIVMSAVCDGNLDCADDSDESPGCTRTDPCTEFECKTSHECLPLGWRCDGNEDCHDGTDESNCTHPENVHCLTSKLKFFCLDRSECLDHNLVCNSVHNCPDGSDEGGDCETHSCKTGGCSHSCFQTPTNSICYCPLGYYLANDNKTCKDVDECGVLGSCSQTCKNTLGSFTCSCQSGYQIVDAHKCQVEGPEPVLIFSATHELKVIKLRSGLAHSVHEGLNHAVGVDYSSATDEMFWTEIANGYEAIKSSKLDGTDLKTVVTNGISVVEDIAVDWVGGNLYFTDSGFFHIVVCKHEGTYCAILVEGLLQPRALVLDPSKGLMFWSDWSHMPLIERSSMDGSERTQLVSKDLGWPNGLAIDHTMQCLYWLDAKLKRVESVSFDGTNRRIVLEHMMMHPFSLAVFEDKFYWTDWHRNTLESCNKFTGGDHSVLLKETTDNVPMGVHIYHPVTQQLSVNPCWNSRCAQLCLLSSKATRYTCACQLGQVLAKDGWSCEGNVTSRFFLSIEDTLYEFHEAKLGATVLKPLKARAKMVIGALAYNPVTKMVIFSDLGTREIISLDLKSQKQTTLVDNLNSVAGLAVDWISGNIYWTDSARRTLEVCSGNGNHRAMLVDQDLDHPVSLALVPAKGFLFVAIQGSRPHIEKMDMDGSNRVIFIDLDVSVPTSLVVDYANERLYWVDTAAGRVEMATLDGKIRLVLTGESAHPTAVAVGDLRVLWTDAAEATLGWTHKIPSKSAGMDTYGPVFNMDLNPHHHGKIVSGMRLLAVSSQIPELSTTGCGVFNGHCSHLCLANQLSYICACPTGMSLHKDDPKSCRAELKCNSLEFTCGDRTCVPFAMVCDGVKDCKDGADEVNCRKCDEKKDFRCGDGSCLPLSWKCDHKHDCVDMSDEINCEAVTCPSDFFTCGDGTCVFLSSRCDGSSDCHDESDESGCPDLGCLAESFRCKDGRCVPDTWYCDGEVDCRDGSDEGPFCSNPLKLCSAEHELTCANGACVELELVCDTEDDCGDGSDEKSCGERLVEAKCPASLHKCPLSNHCVLPSSLCDGHVDCYPHGEDEDNCRTTPVACSEGFFACTDGSRCVLSSWTCDGEHDCPDQSDETLPRCSHLLSVKVDEFHRPIEDEDYVAEQDRKVYSHQSDVFGFGRRGGIAMTSAPSTVSTSSRVGRLLSSPPPKIIELMCDYEQFKCLDGRLCISTDKLCDHREDCADRSDEGPFCSSACDKNNGGCSDLCVATPSGPQCHCKSGFKLDHPKGKFCSDVNECEMLGVCGHYCRNIPGTYSCSCADGYILRNDHRSCKAEGPTPQLLLAYPAKILSHTLGEVHHVEVLASTNHGSANRSSHASNISSMDIDTWSGHVYFSDATLGAILRVPIKNSSDPELVIDQLSSPSAIAVDWLSKVLVYFDRKGYLTVCALDIPVRHCVQVVNVGAVRMSGIQVDPRVGLMYWATWNQARDVGGRSFATGAIERVRMNGDRRTKLAFENVMRPTGLTLDMVHNALYWVDSEILTLETMETSGNNRRIITRRNLYEPMGLTLFEDRLYWADWRTSRIMECDKFTCQDRADTLAHVFKAKAMAVYHPVQQPDASCLCSRLPKKCSHICVAMPNGFACLCPAGMKFNDSSETTCVEILGRGRFIETISESSCNKDGDCLNGGECIIRYSVGICVCESPYEGSRCESPSNVHLLSQTEPDVDHSWIAGVVIGLIFVMVAGAAAMLYYRRFGFEKIRSAFGPLPFVNPIFDEETGEPLDVDAGCPVKTSATDTENAYRSYSNPMFERTNNLDMNSNLRDVRVAFHVSKSQTSLDSTRGYEPTLTLLDPPSRSKR